MSRAGNEPAFPTSLPLEHSDVQGKDYLLFEYSGLTKREWYAGLAIQGILAGGPPGTMDGLAKYAWKMADVMLATEQEKSSGN